MLLCAKFSHKVYILCQLQEAWVVGVAIGPLNKVTMFLWHCMYLNLGVQFEIL